LIDTGTDKRNVRRNAKREFKEVVDVGKSLSQDRKRKAKRVVKAGEGDRGDQKPRPKRSAPKAPAGAETKARPRWKAKTLKKSRTKRWWFRGQRSQQPSATIP
jgi:hypothetical protein